jgi:Rps23 Pro-64 3,4-dihydroxylase Tpa1-like proline 4-hydroxylase
MDNPVVFNQRVFHKDNIHTYRNSFDNAVPFRFIIIDDFLDPALAEKLFRSFPALSAMKTHYTGINERKAEDNNFNNLDKSFTALHESLSSPRFIDWLVSVTGIMPLYSVNDRLGYGLSQGGNGSFLDVHIDYNIHPSEKLHRKINFILFLNPEWQQDWGGFLELWDGKENKRAHAIAPLFNRLVIFECSEISYHGYSQINVPANITRKSYYQYYFTPLPEHIHYHDTIFRARPEDSLFKKTAVPIKDFLKNSVKKTLMTLGLKKFLK